MHTLVKRPQSVTPVQALELLKHGNFRFMNNMNQEKNLMASMKQTVHEQHPFAVIFSCMDSRTSAEFIFDQTFGDIFSIRIAGNVVSSDVLACIEYATHFVGSSLIVVLGHTNCGAVKGACAGVNAGHLTNLLGKITPAVQAETPKHLHPVGENSEFVNAVACANVRIASEEIYRSSPIIAQKIDEQKVGLVPAMYSLSTGKVTFYPSIGFSLAED
ncbi:MAG: carbonic anhydrase [Chitinophagia bacterium]|nr:carbonic anhydrase [Chitinophagia bacterium]